MANENDYPAKYQLEDGSGSVLLETGTGYLIKELQNYADLVISDGAIAYWRLGEGSNASPAADAVGGNNGTYTASPTVAVTGALDGDPDTAVNLNGTTQYITVTGSNSYSPNSGDLTIECWVRPTSTQATTDILTMPLTSGVVNLWVDVTSTTFLFHYSSFSAGSLQFNVGYTVGRWLHVAITLTKSTTTARSYVNGQATSEFASGNETNATLITNAWDGSSPLRIGTNSPSASDFFAGDIDEVAIYPSVLTADQIARHYRCGIQYFDSGLGMAEPAQYPQLLVQ